MIYTRIVIAVQRWMEVKNMKRKTFVKQLMALGTSRNLANAACRQVLEIRDEVRAAGWRDVSVSWEYNLALIYERTRLPAICGSSLTAGQAAKLYTTWERKRSKPNPVESWRRIHPDDI